jgi:hypothetical protein
MIEVVDLLYITSNICAAAAIREVVSDCQFDQVICPDLGFFDRFGEGNVDRL